MRYAGLSISGMQLQPVLDDIVYGSKTECYVDTSS